MITNSLPYPRIMRLPPVRVMPYVWATKMAAIVMKMTEPSLLNTTARGREKLATLVLTSNLSGKRCSMIGRGGALYNKK